MIDLNNVTGGGGSDFELIPEGTIARAIINIQPNPLTDLNKVESQPIEKGKLS